MDIYLEFRIQTIENNGYNFNLSEKNKVDSVRWKKNPLFFAQEYEKEGSIFDLYPIGTYKDLDPDIDLQAIIIKAVFRNDPTKEFITQIGGFVPREDSGTLVTDIPLHLTTFIEELSPPAKGIDNLGPMEAGIRSQINGYTPWTGNPDAIATAILEYNAVKTLYEVIEPQCKAELQI